MSAHTEFNNEVAKDVDPRKIVEDALHEYESGMGRLGREELKELDQDFVYDGVNYGKPWIKKLADALVQKAGRHPVDIKDFLEKYIEKELLKKEKYQIEALGYDSKEKKAYEAKLFFIEKLIGKLTPQKQEEEKKQQEKNKGILIVADPEAYSNFLKNIWNQTRWLVGRVMKGVAGENKWATQLMEPWEQYRAKEREEAQKMKEANNPTKQNTQATSPPTATAPPQTAELD